MIELVGGTSTPGWILSVYLFFISAEKGGYLSLNTVVLSHLFLFSFTVVMDLILWASE